MINPVSDLTKNRTDQMHANNLLSLNCIND